MPSNEYHLITRWRVEGTCREVFDVLDDAPGFVRWWSSVYVQVDELDAGDQRGNGRCYALLTRGWLPYRLRWQLRVTTSHPPVGWSLDARGDLTGTATWSLRQDGRFVEANLDWTIRTGKPLLHYLTFLHKPAFEANHRWAMRQGEKGLIRELARRRTLRRASVRAPAGA